jgi:hypothetical protein
MGMENVCKECSSRRRCSWSEWRSRRAALEFDSWRLSLWSFAQRSISTESHIHSVDLPNIANVRQQLRAVKNVAHIIFGAYIVAEMSTVDVPILRNLLDVVEETPHAQACHVLSSILRDYADMEPLPTSRVKAEDPVQSQ